jgi:hypothetical protein
MMATVSHPLRVAAAPSPWELAAENIAVRKRRKAKKPLKNIGFSRSGAFQLPLPTSDSGCSRV